MSDFYVYLVVNEMCFRSFSLIHLRDHLDRSTDSPQHRRSVIQLIITHRLLLWFIRPVSRIKLSVIWTMREEKNRLQLAKSFTDGEVIGEEEISQTSDSKKMKNWRRKNEWKVTLKWAQEENDEIGDSIFMRRLIVNYEITFSYMLEYKRKKLEIFMMFS